MDTLSDNITTEGRELLSFCLMCYNQKEYIEEALKAAFAQTYTPLEIVISDDCSTDGSYQLLEELVSKYNGPHKVILHRNEHNLRLMKNWEMCCKLAHGVLVIKADGDDVSEPDRAEKIYGAYVESNGQAYCIGSSYTMIDQNGNEIGAKDVPFVGEDLRSIADICVGNGFFYLGATVAYKRAIIDFFPKTEYCDAADDSVFTIRAAMLGKLYTVKDRLVKYRIGSGGTTNHSSYRKTLIKGIKYNISSPSQTLCDVDQVKGIVSEDKLLTVRKYMTAFKEQNEKCLLLYTGKTFKERRIGFKAAFYGKLFSKYSLICHILLLPPLIADFCLKTLLYAQSFFKYKSKKI